MLFCFRIRCHLEECENNSTLPKHEVYDEYKYICFGLKVSFIKYYIDVGETFF